jgi:hypothetical protein
MSSIYAKDGSDRAGQLLTLTLRLHDRLQAETEALETHQAQNILSGIEETRELSNLYRFETARVKKDPSLLDGISGSQKAELKSATEAFQSLLERHAKAVEAAKVVTEGLIAAVAAEASRNQQANATYGPSALKRQAGPQSLNIVHKA